MTNVWQGVVGGAFLAVLRRLWLLLGAVCLGTWFGVRVLANTDAALLSALLGVLIGVYAAWSLAGFRVPGPGKSESWLSPVIGGVNGVLTGLTGSFVVPGVPYLQALALPRDTMIQAMGVLFTVSTVALAVAMNDFQLLTLDLGTLSAAGVLPALLGMVLGQRLRNRLSDTAFRKVFFSALLVLGIYLAVRPVF